MRIILLSFVLSGVLLAESPADLRIAAARKQVEAQPKAFQVYDELAAALCRKARDTGDAQLYEQAAAALDRAEELSPGNFDAAKLRVAVLLGTQKYQDALKVAKELKHKVPDDIGLWALLVDTYVALGDLTEAERAAQWILDLRPASSLGFEKAAKLRELFGDAEGANEFWGEAFRRTAQSDLDQRAWLITQKARLILAGGNAKGAERILAEAQMLFPESKQAAKLSLEIQHAKAGGTK